MSLFGTRTDCKSRSTTQIKLSYIASAGVKRYDAVEVIAQSRDRFRAGMEPHLQHGAL
jgi:hypothetical protein